MIYFSPGTQGRVSMNYCKVVSIQEMDLRTPLLMSLFSSKVQAGFPSPADDYLDKKIDLNEHLIKHPAATFLIRVQGDSMVGIGIYENDELIVDRSVKPVAGKVVVAAVDGHLTVKRLIKKNNKYYLHAENPKYADIEIEFENEVLIWGVVIKVLHNV